MNGLKYKTAEPKLIKKTARTPNQNSRTQANQKQQKEKKGRRRECS